MINALRICGVDHGRKVVKNHIKKEFDRFFTKARATAAALGLGKISSSTIRKDNGVTRGMIRRIEHLVSVEEVS